MEAKCEFLAVLLGTGMLFLFVSLRPVPSRTNPEFNQTQKGDRVVFEAIIVEEQKLRLCKNKIRVKRKKIKSVVDVGLKSGNARAHLQRKHLDVVVKQAKKRVNAV